MKTVGSKGVVVVVIVCVCVCVHLSAQMAFVLNGRLELLAVKEGREPRVIKIQTRGWIT